jgi:mannose-6-phosphate isomerase-like protein (cupin superfamily)
MAKKNNVAELAACLRESYSHLELGRINDHAAYVMNFRDEYPPHSHTRDEFYLVLTGEIYVRFRNAPQEVIRAGECITIPAYVTHSTGSVAGATVIAVKPKDMFPHPQDME